MLCFLTEHLEQTESTSDSRPSPTIDDPLSSDATSTQVDGLQSSPDPIEPDDDCDDDDQQQHHNNATTTDDNNHNQTLKKTFEQSGIFITDDEITMDIATTTGLRKTGFSSNLYDGGAPIRPLVGDSRIPRSPLPERRKSIDSLSSPAPTATTTVSSNLSPRKNPVYRSARKPTAITTIAGGGAASSPQTNKDTGNTWAGRTSKKRSTLSADTFQNPSNLSRHSTGRASSYDKNGRRIVSASTTTSPTKSATSVAAATTSPLAQQILEAAGTAKNDTQMLEKMKSLLSRYTGKGAATDPTAAAEPKLATGYDDFTTAWVNSNGTLDRVINSAGSSPVKQQSLSKRSSAASSIDSYHSRDSSAAMSQIVVSQPRREIKGLSRIPAPIRQNTELY